MPVEARSDLKAKSPRPSLMPVEARSDTEEWCRLQSNLRLEARKCLEKAFLQRTDATSAACAQDKVAPAALHRAQDKENHIFQVPLFPDNVSYGGERGPFQGKQLFSKSTPDSDVIE